MHIPAMLFTGVEATAHAYKPSHPVPAQAANHPKYYLLGFMASPKFPPAPRGRIPQNPKEVQGASESPWLKIEFWRVPFS